MNFAGCYQISLRRVCALLHVQQESTRIPALPRLHESSDFLHFPYLMDEK